MDRRALESYGPGILVVMKTPIRGERGGQQHQCLRLERAIVVQNIALPACRSSCFDQCSAYVHMHRGSAADRTGETRRSLTKSTSKGIPCHPLFLFKLFYSA